MILAFSGAVAYYFLVFSKPAPEEETSDDTPVSSETSDASSDSPAEPVEKFYSRLSGELISSPEIDSAPTFCVQIPNGLDGARDQVGLSQAKIVFEAIAEAGITRFAAIFQNPSGIIGPIRSLRAYYYNWDQPFGCTIVHAGGADDALALLRSSGNRDLDESTTYMFRSNAYYPAGQPSARNWNNLFTSSDLLNNFNSSKGYLSSDITSFPRFTPDLAEKNKVDVQTAVKLDIDQPASGDTSAMLPTATRITFRYMNNGAPTFNPVFSYNQTTNTYDRAYESGAAHLVFDCPLEGDCTHIQLSPSVVIGMIVQEHRASDNYHEDIASIGAGDAYVFQNGSVIIGTWEKSSASAQIVFKDSAGNEISLVPGQTWISAIPAYGSVAYE